ncbi:MAG: DinB family protein [Gemmatimonadota bacterium]|jgi:uncharacterized damage-inducible protein DinB
MYRKVEDFLGSWVYETEATLKVFRQLTDETLGQRVTEEGRTLGRIAWHIVQTLPEMGGRTGLQIQGPGEADPVPSSAQEIGDQFRKAAESLAREVESNWQDPDLEIEDDMYGEMWMRGQTLGALVGHQTHHRGQMTVLMRQAGLQVPGVYGPSKEEWADYGMPPQD